MEMFFFVHLLFMSLGLVLIILGVVTARYGRKKAWWFRLHKMLGILAATFFLFGGAAAIVMVSLSGGSHLAVPHAWFGSGTLLLMIMAVTAGYLQTKVLQKKRMRWIHRNTGRTVLVLSLFALTTGLIAAGIIPIS